MSKNKNVKKSNYQLKFQLNPMNLQCFMKKKSISIVQSDILKKRKKSKSRATSVKKKPAEFQQVKFLTSIIKNAMQDQFEDPKQVTQLLSKIQIQQHEDKVQSPVNEDQILKSFQIFKQPNQRITPQIGFYPHINMEKINENKNTKYSNYINTSEMQLGKQALFNKQHIQQQKLINSFSTQIQSQMTSQRSKKEEFPFTQSYNMQFKGYHLINQHINNNNNNNIQKQQNIVSNMHPINIPSNMPTIPIQPSHSQSPSLFRGLSKQQRHRKSTPIPQNQQFQINLDKIQFDGRTTLMIRHIPNKYTQQMLIDQINQNHKNKYNFFYLPLDSYNPCNVGYAFINFIDTKFIAKFYVEFNKKRWNRFNSQKICELAYARIQGSTALINHFQNSNVMHCRDRRYRPFISFGDNMRT